LIVAIDPAEFELLAWDVFSAATAGTQQAAKLVRIANDITAWSSAAREAQDIILGKEVPLVERGKLGWWTCGVLTLSAACVVLAARVQQGRIRVFFLLIGLVSASMDWLLVYERTGAWPESAVADSTSRRPTREMAMCRMQRG
jgi:hypothetical protein